MKTRVLGVHNLETKHTRHTCFLIDGSLAVDAGSLTSTLSVEEAAGIRAVLLTHHHFDHVRDLPTLGLAMRDAPHSIGLFSLPETLKEVRAHLLNGSVYPDLPLPLNEAAPRYEPRSVSPGAALLVNGYTVKAILVPHPVPAVGYIVQSGQGDCVAFSGDTGGGLLPFFEDELRPHVLFVEVTFPNRMEPLAKVTGHLTPRLLGRELRYAIDLGLPLPKMVVVHRGLGDEEELVREIGQLATELKVGISPGVPEMVV